MRIYRLPRFAIVLAFLVTSASVPVMADLRLARQLAHDCAPELASYCAGVTVGAGRKVACLFAYNDRLSVRCALTLHQATVHVERSMAALRRVVNTCGGDINRHCSKIIPGQGRIALCLLANKPALSRKCRQALSPLGSNP